MIAGSLRRLTCLFALVAITLSVHVARAAPDGGAAVEIEHMTWIEVRDRIASGATTVIVPTGGTEQNGRHMVTGKHNVIVAEAARRIAREVGDLLIAPVLAFVPEGDIRRREGHMAFPGTISLPEPVFAAVLEATARSLAAHGFKTIVFLGDSGGNQPAQRRVAEQLTAEWRPDGVVVANCESYADRRPGAAWLVRQGETAASIGTHAGIHDTSELMAVAPSAVRLTNALDNHDGASGAPGRASADRGTYLLGLRVGAAVAEIRALRDRPSAPPRDGGLFARMRRLIFG